MKQETFNSLHKKRATEVYNQYPSIREVASIMSEELGENITKQNIVRAGISSQTQDWKDEINTEENKFEVEEDDIVFYHKKTNNLGEKINQRIAIPLDEVKEICKSYSRHGENKTGTQILQDYNLTTTAWGLIKSRIGLTKDSDVIPQNILEIIEEQRGEEAVEEEIESASHNAVVNKYKSKFVEKYFDNKEKLDDKIRKRYALEENFLEHIYPYLESYTPRNIDIPTYKIVNGKEETISIGDLHIGKNNTDSIIKTLGYIQSRAIKSDCDTININILGDLGETFVQGGMHSGQVESMEGPFMFDLMLYIVDLLVDFLSGIAKHKKIYVFGLTGNHGRIAKGHDQDHDRTAELIIYELIKRSLPTIDIQYTREKWNTRVIDGISYIIHHGDDRGTSKDPAKILLENRTTTEHTILLFGDKHHLEIYNVSIGVTKIIIPALAGPGEYDTRLGFSSYRGYVSIKRNEFGYPEITPIYLP